MSGVLTRRTVLLGGAGLLGGLLAGCDRVVQLPLPRKILFLGEEMNRGLQRALTNRDALAPEFAASERSRIFRSNGTSNPNTPDYNALAAGRFADYRLQVGGLVATPLSLSLGQLRSMPQRAQTTRHDCVEGWSAIGKWQGPTLADVLRAAGIRDSARYVVFTCFDRFGGAAYYESIDLVDAFHPQTILAYALNDALLPVRNGAPLRLRVERQLGYKQAKYIARIDAVASLAGIGLGKGGYWEDTVEYDWYAGI